jgi:sporulation protein YlmC with PRC-barrel domain
MMRLAADLLDKQLIDRRGEPCGKVDGIVLRIDDGPPRVVAVEVGCITLARRLGPRCERWTRRLVERVAGRNRGEYRIAWSRVLDVGKDVRVDLESNRTAMMRAERWLRAHVIRRIPGA